MSSKGVLDVLDGLGAVELYCVDPQSHGKAADLPALIANQSSQQLIDM